MDVGSTNSLDIFHEMKLLGKGSYGKVWKAQHRIDERFYAIKCTLSDCVHLEAKVMSSLLHDHLVRYYNSWLGPKPDKDAVISSSNASSDDGIFFQKNQSAESQQSSWDDSEDESEPSEKNSLERATNALYIQMEYCDGGTLRNAIDEGLSRNMEQVRKLFSELVIGLAYLHGKGIVHRDLNPKNIFLHEGVIKIGDLGMATYHQEQMVHSGEEKCSVFGTELYLAPESSRRKSSRNMKLDIYSLGIIKFEMCWQRDGEVTTENERARVLENLRQTAICFPPNFDPSLFEHDLIKSCLNHDPTQRPTVEDLRQRTLQCKGFNDETDHLTDTKPSVTCMSITEQESVANLSVKLESASTNNQPIFHVGIFSHPKDEKISGRLKMKIQNLGYSVLTYHEIQKPSKTDLEKSLWFVEECMFTFWVATSNSINDADMVHFLNVSFEESQKCWNKCKVRSLCVVIPEEDPNFSPPTSLKVYHPLREDESFQDSVTDMINELYKKLQKSRPF
ncbi:uncharacterized protein LOC143446386 isoform X1 [Clavelina lepadiformis]|uniref:uncharacterized protein LOC143446386 isoform X1 n=1 Tax=Clavelina lepadiformis TaxID=159417 RepID=UPI0040436754